MADFTEAQKKFVIECWACDMEPGEVLTAFTTHFQEEGKELASPSSAQLARYNLDYYAGESMSAPHKTHFRQTRERFRSDLSLLPAAHRAYRVRELTTLYKKQKRKSDVIAKDLLKQIAQEMGGQFEQRVSGASPAEVREYLAEKFAAVRAAIEALVKDEQVRKDVLAVVTKAECVEE